MKMKRGLTLGKFAPFHKGHQSIIETALSEMDEVIVIIYDSPDIIHIPLNIRSQWIKELYQQVKVIEAWDGPTDVGYTPEIKKAHEDYILNRLKISDITAFYSSEEYGIHISEALNAQNRQVDPNREKIRISGTQIRENPFKFKRFLHHLVYKDFIINVVFLGAPCTGKTTIAKRLAADFHTEWMPEYGREYWEKYQKNRRLTLEQLVEIAVRHLEREDRLIQNSDKYLFTDTNAITTFIFSLYYHGKADQRLTELANTAYLRYDISFLCDTDIPYDDTWDRSGDVNRKIFQKQIIADLNVRKIPYFILSGNVEKRVEFVKAILSKYLKYDNILETKFFQKN